jgi:DNA-binding transcriptional LysR family regulator
MSLSVRGMTAFVALTDAGSFSGAAERLGLTPSAMSKMIARLEDHLGTRLVQRTTRRMQLTDVGIAYAQHARRILEEIDTLDREIQSRDVQPRGTLRVSAASVLGHVRVLPIVIAFQESNPEIKVHLDLSDRVVDMIEERIDVAIRTTTKPPPSFVARKLDDDRRVLCATPQYIERRGIPETPDALASHDCVLCTARQPYDTWYLRSAEGEPTVRPVHVNGRLTVGNMFSLRDAVLAGFGIADLPKYLVEDDLQAGRLVSILPALVVDDRSIYALYAPSPFLPVKVRAFVDALRRGFRTREALRTLPIEP